MKDCESQNTFVLAHKRHQLRKKFMELLNINLGQAYINKQFLEMFPQKSSEHDAKIRLEQHLLISYYLFLYQFQIRYAVSTIDEPRF